MIFGNVGIATIIVTATSFFSSAKRMIVGLNTRVLGIEYDKDWLPTRRLSSKLIVAEYLLIFGKLEAVAEHFSCGR